MRRKKRHGSESTVALKDIAKAPSPVRTLNFGQRLAIYLSVIGFGVVGSLFVHENFGLDQDQSIGLTMGPLFLLTATGRPWWLYSTIREVRWFALITNESAMRTVLAALGILLVLFGAGAFGAP